MPGGRQRNKYWIKSIHLSNQSTNPLSDIYGNETTRTDRPTDLSQLTCPRYCAWLTTGSRLVRPRSPIVWAYTRHILSFDEAFTFTYFFIFKHIQRSSYKCYIFQVFFLDVFYHRVNFFFGFRVCLFLLLNFQVIKYLVWQINLKQCFLRFCLSPIHFLLFNHRKSLSYKCGLMNGIRRSTMDWIINSSKISFMRTKKCRHSKLLFKWISCTYNLSFHYLSYWTISFCYLKSKGMFLYDLFLIRTES